MKAELSKALTEYVQRKAKVNTTVGILCTVDSYDATTKTCYCVPVNEELADIQQVKVCPDTGTGIFIQPKVNSKVMVEFMGDSSAYISMWSEVEAVNIGGDQYGGLVKIEDLVDKINNLEDLLNDLISKYNSHTHPIPSLVTTCGAGTGSTTASNTSVTGTTEATTLTPTVKADIENPRIKHGDGTN